MDPTDPNLTLDEVLDQFVIEYQQANSIVPESAARQLRLLRDLHERLPYPIWEMTRRDVAHFVASETRRGQRPRTTAWYLTLLRPFFTWCEGVGMIDLERAMQLRSVRPPRGAGVIPKPRPYTTEEIGHFYDALDDLYTPLPTAGIGSMAMRSYRMYPDMAIRRHLWRHAKRLQLDAQVALALVEGLRRIEIERITIPALHPDNDQLVVMTAKQLPGTDIKRAIPYAPYARQAVGDWLAFRAQLGPDHDYPWLVLTARGAREQQLQPQTPDLMKQSLLRLRIKPDGSPRGPRYWGHAASANGWAWHRFRHSAATEWLRSGVPLEKVRLFMGHQHIQTTLMYVQILKGDMDAAFDAAHSDFASRLGLDRRRAA